MLEDAWIPHAFNSVFLLSYALFKGLMFACHQLVLPLWVGKVRGRKNSICVPLQIPIFVYSRPQINLCLNCVKLRPLTSNLYDIEISWIQNFYEVTYYQRYGTEYVEQIDHIIHMNTMTDSRLCSQHDDYRWPFTYLKGHGALPYVTEKVTGQYHSCLWLLYNLMIVLGAVPAVIYLFINIYIYLLIYMASNCVIFSTWWLHDISEFLDQLIWGLRYASLFGVISLTKNLSILPR